MNHLLAQKGLRDQIICDSAGTSSYHIGSSPDSRMCKAALKRGVKMIGKARQFEKADFEEFDLILAMDRHNYRDILSLDREKKYQDKVELMCNYAAKYLDRDVPDPYYGGVDGFDYVIDLLFDACENLLESIINK